MIDPAQASARMQPGDKMSVSYHKAKAEEGSGTFVDNARKAGMIPGGAPAAPAMPQMQAVSQPAVPDHRALLLAHLRHRMMMGR